MNSFVEIANKKGLMLTFRKSIFNLEKSAIFIQFKIMLNFKF